MVSRWLSSGLALLFWLIVTAVTPGRSVAAPGSPLGGTTLHVLPNGLRVLVCEHHETPLVALDIWVRAGSGSEGPDEEGAAHFIEHLLFKGTATRQPGEIDEAIEEMGAVLAAGTGRDGAHFYVTVPSSDWATALAILADALRNAAFRPEDLERERSVILDEIALDRADPKRQATDRLYEGLFPGHPYGHPTDGRAEAVRSLSRDRIVGFWRRLYVPENVTVALVGDLDAAGVEPKVAGLLGDWPIGAPRASAGPQPPGRGAGPRRVASSTETLAALGCRLGPPSSVVDVCAADLAAVLLGDPRAGWLAASVTAAGAGSEVSARYTPLCDGAVFALYAAPAAKRADDVQRALAEAVDRLTREGLAPAELEWARRSALGAWIYDTETYGGQARLLGYYDCVASYEIAVRYADTMRALKGGDVAAFASRLPAASPVGGASSPEAPR